MTVEGKKLAFELGQFVMKAATSLEEKAAMKRKVHEALQSRVRKVLKEMREQRSHQTLGDYLDFRRTALLAGGVDEDWRDYGRTIVKGALRLVKHGIGIKGKSAGALKAVAKKKKTKKIVLAQAKVDLPKLNQKPKLDLSTKR